jgi:chromosome segregation ATPase
MQTVLSSLLKREKSARKILRSTADSFETDALERVEAEIDALSRSIDNRTFEAFETELFEEEKAVELLEAKNRSRVKALPLRNANRTREVKAVRVEEFVPRREAVIGEATGQIRALSELVFERKKQVQEKQNELAVLRAAQLRARTQIELELSHKERRIGRLQARLEKIDQFKKVIDGVEGKVVQARENLDALVRRKEELTHRNHVVEREMRKIERMKGRYREKREGFEEGLALFEGRLAAYTERQEEVKRHAKAVQRYQQEVEELEMRVEETGRRVGGALGKSQVELEKLDLIANQSGRASRSLTLEESLHMMFGDRQSRKVDSLE